MSELTATNCGCGCDNGCANSCGCGGNGNGCGLNNSCLWIILLLCCCGGWGGNGCGGCKVAKIIQAVGKNLKFPSRIQFPESAHRKREVLI